MNHPKRIAPGPMYAAAPPVRDPAYLRFLKQFPCVGCGRTWRIEPMHNGPHGLNQKASDLDALPACRACHDEQSANPVQFAERHQLDIPALIEMFRGFYRIVKGEDAA